ncbi:MAG TPA: hypothetical protein VG735_07840 [Caulobacterales bacterium]|nr:hypothetical protein [Caulobacterales bacterium]
MKRLREACVETGKAIDAALEDFGLALVHGGAAEAIEKHAHRLRAARLKIAVSEVEESIAS